VPVAQARNPSYSGGLRFEVSPGKQLARPYLKKRFTKIELVEWFKALSSSPVTAKTKKSEKFINKFKIFILHIDVGSH
jgi:hypothetical protein